MVFRLFLLKNWLAILINKTHNNALHLTAIPLALHSVR